MAHLSITPATKVGEIVATYPLLSRVFARVGIDFCCGGKKTLADACAAKGLDAPTLAAALEAGAQLIPAGAMPVSPATMTLTALADHIEATHHAYVKEELPVLVTQAERVAMKHGERDPRLIAVAETTIELANEMFHHMMKEEQILFPIVRELEQRGADAAGAAGHCGGIANPIRVMEAEHESAGGAIARLRELTDGFTPDENSCNTHRALLAALARFEGDLHQHVHKENNVLFPRALALESELVSAGA